MSDIKALSLDEILKKGKLREDKREVEAVFRGEPVVLTITCPTLDEYDSYRKQSTEVVEVAMNRKQKRDLQRRGESAPLEKDTNNTTMLLLLVVNHVSLISEIADSGDYTKAGCESIEEFVVEYFDTTSIVSMAEAINDFYEESQPSQEDKDELKKKSTLTPSQN